MDKAQLIALYILLNNEKSDLNTITEHIQHFEFIEENVRAVLESLQDS